MTAEELAWRGIELCRQGDWQEGPYWLGSAAEAEERDSGPGSGRPGSGLPAVFYAYLGYGVARYQGRQAEGLELCRRAVGMDRYQPESYYFLARLYLLADDRRSAVQVVETGLEIDATNEDLLRIRSGLGERRRRILPFLRRRHLLNRWLGRFRHRLLERRRG